MNFEELMENDACTDYDDDYDYEFLDFEDDKIPGNPYGAGRYCYMRSANNNDYLFLGNEAAYDPEYNLWYEYIGCGYACERDGIALQEADDADLFYLHEEHPNMTCKESYYDFTYGNTREEVAWASFFLTEYADGKSRIFSFDLEGISMEEAKEYVAAMELWHRTGEFSIGPYQGIPAYGPWRTE